MVTFGNASGPVPPFSPLELSKRGSLYVTRPTLQAHMGAVQEMAADLFATITKIEIGQTYPLADAARAHRDLEARATTGATVLVP